MLSPLVKNIGAQLCFCRIPALSWGRRLSSERVRIEGGSIHVVRAGHGSHPLLLLPGALGSANTDFAPQLAGLDQVG